MNGGNDDGFGGQGATPPPGEREGRNWFADLGAPDPSDTWPMTGGPVQAKTAATQSSDTPSEEGTDGGTPARPSSALPTETRLRTPESPAGGPPPPGALASTHTAVPVPEGPAMSASPPGRAPVEEAVTQADAGAPAPPPMPASAPAGSGPSQVPADRPVPVASVQAATGSAAPGGAELAPRLAGDDDGMSPAAGAGEMPCPQAQEDRPADPFGRDGTATAGPRIEAHRPEPAPTPDNPRPDTLTPGTAIMGIEAGAGAPVPEPRAADDGSEGPRATEGDAAAPQGAAGPGDEFPIEVGLSVETMTSERAGRAILRLPYEVLARAGLRPGDTVAVDAARRTHARVLPGRGLRAVADRHLAANIGCPDGGAITIAKVALPMARRVVLCPGAGSPGLAGHAASLQDVTVTEGDWLTVKDEAGRLHRAEVEAVEPGGAGRIGPATVFDGPDVPGHVPGYEGIAGLRKEIAAVHEMVENPLRRPDLFGRLGLDPPRGILFTGPPGSGKTLLARAVAERTDAAFFHVAGPEIVSKHYGESEAALRAVFDAAARSAPAIVFIDEIDAIAPQRGSLSGEKQVERRVVAQLLTLLDGLEDRGRIVVMAATNMPGDLDPALRRPGRFDREIAFAAPGCADREAILALHLASAPLAQDADCGAIAARAHGYVGADLAALAREAGLAALARSSRGAGGIDALEAQALEITGADLEAGFRATRPSALRDAAVPDRPVRWSDIGGAFAAKSALREAVLWPMAHPEAMEALGLRSPRGILLAGPPGTGKTMLVRALATESAMNFVSARPASLLRQHLGEAERAIADLFARARATAPTLLFLDEIDGLAPRRGTADAAVDRVVAQLLVELDGLETNRDLVVVAATNRPDALDAALVRPGRFDTRVEVGLPDAAEGREIIEVLARARPLDDAVDLAGLAARMTGWTPAEMAASMEAAARRALSRALTGGEECRLRPGRIVIAPEDFDAVLHRMGPARGEAPTPAGAGFR